VTWKILAEVSRLARLSYVETRRGPLPAMTDTLICLCVLMRQTFVQHTMDSI
jgi:hypothetical protein